MKYINLQFSRLFFIVTLMNSFGSIARSQHDLTHRFVLADYLEAVSRLEEKFARCGGECVATTNRFRSGTAVTHAHYSFAFTRRAGCLTETNLDGDEKAVRAVDVTKKKLANPFFERVRAYNEDYSFFLEKPSPGAAYTVGSLSNGPDEGMRQLRSGLRNPSLFFTRLYVTPIKMLFGLPGFRVERVIELKATPDHTKLKVEFTTAFDIEKLTKKNGFHIVSGWLVLSPDDEWLLNEYGIVQASNTNLSSQSTHFGRYEYTRVSGAGLQPARYTASTYRNRFDADPAASGASPGATEDIEFKNFRFGETPAREFTLAAFGLPEFIEPAAKRLNRPFPWWIVVASVGAFGLAAALRLLAKRSRSPNSERVA